MSDTKTAELLSQIQEIFRSAMGDDVKVDLDTEKDSVLEWDSINHLNLVVELESAFDLGLSMQEIEELHSVRGIIDLINNRKK